MDSRSGQKERRRRQRRVADENRKRAPQACERCQRRKSKCIDTPSGVCRRCQEAGQPCTFSQDQSVVLALRGCETHAAEAAVDAVAVDSVAVDVDAGHTARPPERMSQAAAAAASAVGLPVDDVIMYGSGALASSSSSSSETFMWSGFLSRLREAFCLDPQPGTSDNNGGLRRLVVGQNGQNGQNASLAAAVSPAERQRLRLATASFPPQPIANFLVAVVIEHGTDSFFYFDQAQLVAELEQFYRDPRSHLRSDASFVCLALAVFALGSQWTALAKPEGSAAKHSSNSFLPDSQHDPGRIFYSQARIVLGDIVGSTSIRSVQTAFILGVYLMPASAIGASYVFMGLALRKAVALDLHQNDHDPSIGDREREIRHRLWWAIYALERTLTIKLNRPPSIHQDIITAPLPQPYEPLDAVQIFENVQLQIANARLVKILDRISTSMSTTTWPDQQNEEFEKYEADLVAWEKRLPARLHLDRIHPKSSSYRAVVHLYLNYYFASIAMGRVSVVKLVQANLHAAFRPHPHPNPEEGGSLPQVQIDATVDRLARPCIQSAKNMLQLFERLTATGNLTRFSFTDFQGCSIATVILLLASIMEEGAECKTRAAFGLDSLRRMAGDNATARMGVGFVEALQAIANEAGGKLDWVRLGQHDTAVPASVSLSPADGREAATAASNYNQWIEWLTGALRLEAAESGGSGNEPEPEPEPEHTATLQTLATLHTPHTTHTTTPPGGGGPTGPLPSFAQHSPGGVHATNSAALGWEPPAAAAVSLQKQQTLLPAGDPDPGIGTAHAHAWEAMLPPDPLPPGPPFLGQDLPTSFYGTGDDYIYLMGLTGLDVLNFSDSLERDMYLI